MVFYALLTTFSALLLYFFAFERKNRATRLQQKPTVIFAGPTAPRPVIFTWLHCVSASGFLPDRRRPGRRHLETTTLEQMTEITSNRPCRAGKPRSARQGPPCRHASCPATSTTARSTGVDHTVIIS